MDSSQLKVLYRDGMDYIGLIKPDDVNSDTKKQPIMLMDCLRCIKAIEVSNALV